jgi:hypothetical protein
MIEILDDNQLYGPGSAGYSRQKVGFLRHLCGAARQGKLRMDDLMTLSDAELSARLLSLHGIGEWCAGVAMMHTLRRADVMLYGEWGGPLSLPSDILMEASSVVCLWWCSTESAAATYAPLLVFTTDPAPPVF